ncbi:pleckstrin homology domain-containing family A member 6 isoform X5 [Anguilla anguilla]|uniref:pleckstrin homology domain-containing family A member 6 isoform X5 n=1 Tax=Anguilla anguilla TaxID=7936 RepID=UPI0015A88185|nr:pleckstrin homology domain-containing family A member 6 isoform X5 [Anguilla anguilla]
MSLSLSLSLSLSIPLSLSASLPLSTRSAALRERDLLACEADTGGTHSRWLVSVQLPPAPCCKTVLKTFDLQKKSGHLRGMRSQNDQNGPTGQTLIPTHVEETRTLQKHPQTPEIKMNGRASGKTPTSVGSDLNSNSIAMVTGPSPEQRPNGRTSRNSKKAATFGKRSNSMRRNPKAEVTKQGWLFKQASSGVKQWNKRWFVLADRCLFYYKDEKEDAVLGSLPLLSFRIAAAQPSDSVSRKHAFKASSGEEEEADGNGSGALCLQAEHAGIRTYYFSAESQQEQEDWVKVMSEAARVIAPPAQRNESTPPTGQNNGMVAKGAEPVSRGEADGQRTELPEVKHEVNGVGAQETPPTPPTPPTSSGPGSDCRDGDDRGGGDRDRDRDRDRGGTPQPNGWANHSTPAPGPAPAPPQEPREAKAGGENVVLRRGFVPRTQPERLAQRKSSMTQLQQWVNQRRGPGMQDDLRSPSRYYTVSRGVPADYYGLYGGPQYVEEYPLYPPGVRPESICSVSGAFDRPPPPRWASEERRRSLRDGSAYPPWMMHPPPPAPPPQHPGYYTQLDSAQNSMRRLSLQPRSRSVPRSPSAGSQGPYSPGPRNYASPMRSPSARFDRCGPGRMRDDVIYADPAVYGIRRSISSPKYEYPGDRRSMSPGMYHYNYPASPSLHDKMEDILDLQLQRNLEYLDQQVSEGDHLISMVTRLVENSSPRAKLYSQAPPFHDLYRDLHPAFKANEMEINKLLGRLCEQNRILKDQEAVVHRLRADKDSLEGALVATHQELDLYRGQSAVTDKLQLKKETLQNQLINIRGELSQASSALTTTRMEFEALEDEVNAVHGDLWEQLNAGGQNELLQRHLHKEFWRIQDVLEGLHKNNPSRGTDTAKHRVTSGASGSFCTNSPASPLSSVSLTSPLSPFSPVSGSQASPTKPVGLEHKYSFRSESATGEKANSSDRLESDQECQTNTNKVGVVPPRTKSPTEDTFDGVPRRNGKVPNGHITRERPKSAVFPAEVKSKMSVEEQNERIRRNQSSSVRDKRRSLNLSNSDSFKSTTNYRVVRRRLTAHEVDIKDLEAAVRGEGVESPREEIARLRRLQGDPDSYSADISKELSGPDMVTIPERYLDIEPSVPLSPEEQREKEKKVERIKTLIAKSNMQNAVPLLDGPVDRHADHEQKLQLEEKRIEISCALAAEASRRSRLLSAQCAPSSTASPTSLAPTPSADHDSPQFMKV